MATTEQSLAQAKAQVEAAKAKVDAAKAKIAEARAKSDAEIRKFEKSKALAQTITNAYKAGGIKGGISAVIASQVGSIRAKLVAEVNTRVNEAISKFANKCPPEKELQRIIKTKNNLKKAVASLDKRVNAFRPVAANINTAVSIIKLAVQVITSIPVPTAIIPPQVGGLGIPINVLTKYSNSLDRLNKQLDLLQQESQAITSIVGSVAGVTQGITIKLDSLDAYIERCYLDSLSNTTDLLNIDATLAAIQPPNSGDSTIATGPDTGQTNPAFEYKGYKLEIVEDINSPAIAPRRFAIARDRRGIVVLQGPSSFSADTQVLLDEIKFRIDNQLP